MHCVPQYVDRLHYKSVHCSQYYQYIATVCSVGSADTKDACISPYLASRITASLVLVFFLSSSLICFIAYNLRTYKHSHVRTFLNVLKFQYNYDSLVLLPQYICSVMH